MSRPAHRVSLASVVPAILAAALVMASWGGATAGMAATRAPGTEGTILFDVGVGGFVASQSRVYVIRSDGAQLSPLTASPGVNAAPAWSPDGKRIAYLNGNQPRLWVMNADGGGKRRVSPYEGSLGFNRVPQWSPDGAWIAFTRAAPVVGGAVRGNDTLWIVEVDGSRSFAVPRGSKIGDAQGAWAPSWSPDGKRLAFLRGSSDRGAVVWVAKADGTRARSLGRLAEFLAWSPDGRWIALLHDVTLSIVRPDGSGARRLAKSSTGPGTFAWSPDGKDIAYVDYTGRLTVVGVDGRRARRLTRAGSTSFPAWSPDGTAIAYTQHQSMFHGGLYVTRLAGGSTMRINEIDGQSEAVDWRPLLR